MLNPSQGAKASKGGKAKGKDGKGKGVAKNAGTCVIKNGKVKK